MSLSSTNSSKNLKMNNSPEFKIYPEIHNLDDEQSEKGRNLGRNANYLNPPHQQNGRKSEIIYLEELNMEEDWNSFFAVPFLNLFHWTLLVPSAIKYDKMRGEFFMEKATILFKVLSYIWLLCLSIYLTLFMLMDSDQPYTVKAITIKVIWGCYTLFDITAISCLRSNGDQLANLLTEGNKVRQLLHHLLNKGRNTRPSCVCRKVVIWFLSGVTLIYATFFMIFVMTQLTASATNFYNIFLNHTSGNNDDVDYHCTSDKDVLCNLIERFNVNFYATILLILWFFMAFCVELIWMAFLLLTAACGYCLKKMLTDCIQAIEGGRVTLFQGIRIYTRISLLLEDFNKIFGYTLLWIVIASILFQAATLGEFLAGCTNGIMFDVVNVLGFVPFIATMYTASELHITGLILPAIIKRQFMNMDVITDYEQAFRLIQGTNVVQFDTLSNNMGLKGAGFFTISYAFVGSMIGVIITYALVKVQFKLDEIPLS